MIASTSLTFDPVWPWSASWLGLPGLLAVAAVLAVVTVATYLLAQPRRPGRLAIVLALRLGALFVACLLVLRPSLASQDDSILPSKLLVVLDASQSMTVTDELNGQSRWDRARAILRSQAVEGMLKRLQDEQKLEIVYYQAAEDVGPYRPDGKAEGKRTDMGRWLSSLWKAHGEDRNLRGLLLLTDGADNGTQFPTLEEAARWRAAACPVQPFALGSPTTTPNQRDIAFVQDRISVAPTPVRVKNELKVRAVLNAPGFENARVTLRLLIDGKEVAPPRDVTLLKTNGNEVEMTGPAPDKAGEVKVTLRAEPVVGEVTSVNNEISTYATVTKDGVSVLWVEGKRRAFESVFAIRHVLGRDPRFKVFYTERLGEGKPAADQGDWFNFTKRHYDVIVIGDVSAKRFAGGNPDVFRQIHELVEKKQTGLLMLGGYETFANSDWQTVPEVATLLPVELNDPGQVEGPVRVRPTPEAFSQYVVGPPTNQAGQQAAWDTVLSPLDGMTRLGKLKEGATAYARGDAGQLVLAGTKVGEGRVLAFAGDTTWKAWRRSPEAIKVYEQFWRQTVLWLAHQENAGGNVWIEPDTRRLAAGNNTRLGFTLKIRGKGGKDDVKDVRFTARVIGPQKDETEVPVVLERGEYRGYFWKTNAPGEYTLKASGSGKDVDGSTVSGDPEVKFLAYAEDLETMRPAADHDFLAKVAAAGGGKLRLAGESELEKFLQELLAQPVAQNRPKAELWPDWRRDPASTSVRDQVGSLWQSGLLPSFVLFSTLLCVEWYLRRRWGMV